MTNTAFRPVASLLAATLAFTLWTHTVHLPVDRTAGGAVSYTLPQSA